MRADGNDASTVSGSDITAAARRLQELHVAAVVAGAARRIRRAWGR